MSGTSRGQDGWEVRANHTQGRRAVGGKLVVASGRLRFRPHAFDLATGGHTLDEPLRDVVSIDVAPRTFHPFDGGLRKRLRLRFADGTEALFVVNRVAKVGERIAGDARSAGASPIVEL